MAQKTKVTAKTGSHKATGAAHKSATKATAKAVGKPSAVKAHGQAAAAKAKASGQKAGSAQGAKSSAKSAAKPAAKPLVSKIIGKGSAKSGVKSVVTGKAAAPAKVGGSNSVASAKATAARIAMKPMQPHGAAKSAKPSTQKVAAKPAPTQAAIKPDAVVQNASKPSMVSGAKAAIAARPTAPVRTMPAAVAKPAGQKITASVSNVTPKVIAEKTVAARQIIAAQSKPVNSRHGFKTNEFIVYPAHGVGRIVGIEEQEIAGMSLELFVITFDKEKLTLRVPTGQMQNRGMRKLSDDVVVRKALETLKGRARIKRTMWSRRAQEYVAKINSGDLISIAEVVRDLYRSEAQPEQSYSERQLYESALDRMSREIAAVEKLDERGAVQRITDVLAKSARGRRAEEAGDAAEAEIKAA